MGLLLWQHLRKAGVVEDKRVGLWHRALHYSVKGCIELVCTPADHPLDLEGFSGVSFGIGLQSERGRRT